jgi:hypothetical protein
MFKLFRYLTYHNYPTAATNTRFCNSTHGDEFSILFPKLDPKIECQSNEEEILSFNSFQIQFTDMLKIIRSKFRYSSMGPTAAWLSSFLPTIKEYLKNQKLYNTLSLLSIGDTWFDETNILDDLHVIETYDVAMRRQAAHLQASPNS